MPDEQPFPPIALTVENLAASRGGTAVQAGVRFALAGGEALAVTGPNGVGKFTLLRLLAGLLRPTEGKVVLAPEVEAVARVKCSAVGAVPADAGTTLHAIVGHLTNAMACASVN